MRTTQYVRQEKAIASADTNGIRERWLWGLRLLRDSEAMSSLKSLRHGVTDQLITSAKSGGLNLSAREIQRRLQCARTYATEAQIRHAAADFATWRDLAEAGFPPYEAAEGEGPADHRTDAERQRDHARALAEIFGDQGTLFPVADFEPHETPLKDLKAYADEMADLTERFRKRDAERQAYLDKLIEAAGGDLSVTWQSAHERAFGEEVPA